MRCINAPAGTDRCGRSAPWRAWWLPCALGVVLAACGGQPSNQSASPASSQPTAIRATAGARVYVTNEASGDLSIIDAASLEVVATVPLGKRPRGVQPSPDGSKLYVALSGSPSAPPGVDESTLPPPDRSADGIGEIDVATNKLVRVHRVGTDPEQVAVSADGKRLFVANEDAALTSVYDLTTNAIVKTIPVGQEPEGVTLSPDGRTVYVTSEDAGEVYAIDTSSFAVLAKIPVGRRPRSVAFLPDGSRAFVALENDAAIAVVDAIKHAFVRTLALGDPAVRPMGIAVDRQGASVYVTTGRYGALFAINAASLDIAASVPVGQRPWGVALTADGTKAFTANGPSNDVSVVDLRTRSVTKRIPVGDRPWGVAIVEPR